MRNILVLVCLLVISCSFLCSCNNNELEHRYAFIGDSEIARWDLQAYFPDLITENKGKGGSGLAYIQEMANSMEGRIAVVQYGTNDIGKFDSIYAEKYVEAISNLNSKKVFVLSMFPRNFKNDPDWFNDKIFQMNTEIQIRVKQKGWTYVNVFPLLMKDGDIDREYFSDGLHLSASGYELVSSELRKVLR